MKDTNPKNAMAVNKPSMSVVPANVLLEVAVGMTEGAAKYGRHNYRVLGGRSSVYFDATMRHLLSWWEGEDIDPDSGLSHITKAITSLVVLRDTMLAGTHIDDRPPVVGMNLSALTKKVAEINKKYSEANPKHFTEKDKTDD